MEVNMNELDLSGLPGTQVDVVVEKEPAVERKAEAGEVDVVLVVLDDVIKYDFPLENLIERISNGYSELVISRRAWNGIRNKKESKRIAGMRKLLYGLGFKRDESRDVVDESANGRLSESVYSKDGLNLRILYGIEENYGHRIVAG
jgi:hypothetical protein